MSNQEVNFKPGVYHVNARGRNSTFSMSVKFSKNKIENINIDQNNETQGISRPVFEKLPQRIIENQALDVDVVSGATMTSKAIIDAVAEAAKLAGVNSEDLKNRSQEKVNNKNLKDITMSTDVLVVGAGGAGLAAAATVLDNNKSVIIIEKFSGIGGNTNRTGGQINAADPVWQRTFQCFRGERETLEKILNLKSEDIPQEYQDDLEQLKIDIRAYFNDLDNGKDYLFDSDHLHCIQTLIGGTRTDLNEHETHGNYQLVKYLTANALNTINWLKEKGVDFKEDNVTEPVGSLWRRAREPKQAEGYGYVHPLEKYVLKHGGKIITDCKAEKLLIKNNKVIGITGKIENKQNINIFANNVILATGGYSANLQMVKKYDNYWGNLPDSIPTTNSPAITGDGIKMGLDVGAKLVDMQFTQLMPSSDPETGEIFRGIDCPPSDFVFVNKKGKRFVNEYAPRDELCKAIFAQGGVIYNISDKEIAKTRFVTTDEQLEEDCKTGHCFKADTVRELAEKINIDPNVLEETIKKYNASVKSGTDKEFGKTSFNHQVLVPPFYATPRSPATHHTMGGLKINVKTQVINNDDQVISGLFACGEVAGGVHAGNRLGGNALLDIFTFGQVAGKQASL